MPRGGFELSEDFRRGNFSPIPRSSVSPYSGVPIYASAFPGFASV
ncbi:MAG: hypothetical protein ACFFDK_09480 [Promethearchaeota archaeon]